MPDDRSYTSSSLAKAAGCSRKALRIYQAHGLISKPSKARRACYDARTVERLRLIVALRQLGLSIGRIGALFKVSEEKRGGPAAALPLAHDLSEIVRAVTDRIELLTRIRRELILGRETLFRCAGCDKSAEACEECAENGRLDPVARSLILMDPARAA